MFADVALGSTPPTTDTLLPVKGRVKRRSGAGPAGPAALCRWPSQGGPSAGWRMGAKRSCFVAKLLRRVAWGRDIARWFRRPFSRGSCAFRCSAPTGWAPALRRLKVCQPENAVGGTDGPKACPWTASVATHGQPAVRRAVHGTQHPFTYPEMSPRSSSAKAGVSATGSSPGACSMQT